MKNLPESILKVEAVTDETVLTEVVSNIDLFELEDISISAISTLKNSTLKDLLNDAVSARLAFHLGGSYTSPA